MCGRFYVDEGTAREVEKVIRNVDQRIKRMHLGDIYPSQTAGILTGDGSGLDLKEMHWGFRQYQKKGLLINARAETALERKMFRESVLHRRCIIPARHFYEWDSDKNKMTFFRKDKPALYLAGFYNRFQDEDHFIILTTRANASVNPVHSRMPLILDENELEDWVYDDKFTEVALHKIQPELEQEQEYEQEYEQQNLFLT